LGFSRDELIEELGVIRRMGWVVNSRPGNPGGVGNTLEDLLGIEENNLPTSDAGDYEIKSQRSSGGALTTLFHREPDPRVRRLVPNLLLPSYGWPHEEAGAKYPQGEMSFRQTINGLSRTSRGFGIELDMVARQLRISFDASAVAPKHSQWLESVSDRVGLLELDPIPYWTFDDIIKITSSKLMNCIYVKAKSKRSGDSEYFHYASFQICEGFTYERFEEAIRNGDILIDFDARTGHNHGTKFRMRQNLLPQLYNNVINIGK
jgi:hypothetical protein